MHANQMMPTQYGRHETNFPHMEYVRERHYNEQLKQQQQQQQQHQQQQQQLPNRNGNNDNNNEKYNNKNNNATNKKNHNKIYNEGIKGTNNKKSNNNNGSGGSAGGSETASVTGGVSNNKRNNNNINQQQNIQKQQQQLTQMQQQQMIVQKYRMPLNPQQMQRLKKRTSFTPSQSLASIKRQQMDKSKLQQQQQQQQILQQHHIQQKTKITNKHEPNKTPTADDSDGNVTTNSSRSNGNNNKYNNSNNNIKTMGPQATISKAFINNQSDGLSLPTTSILRTDINISETDVGSGAVAAGVAPKATKKKLRLKRSAKDKNHINGKATIAATTTTTTAIIREDNDNNDDDAAIYSPSSFIPEKGEQQNQKVFKHKKKKSNLSLRLEKSNKKRSEAVVNAMSATKKVSSTGNSNSICKNKDKNINNNRYHNKEYKKNTHKRDKNTIRVIHHHQHQQQQQQQKQKNQKHKLEHQETTSIAGNKKWQRNLNSTKNQRQQHFVKRVTKRDVAARSLEKSIQQQQLLNTRGNDDRSKEAAGLKNFKYQQHLNSNNHNANEYETSQSNKTNNNAKDDYHYGHDANDINDKKRIRKSLAPKDRYFAKLVNNTQLNPNNGSTSMKATKNNINRQSKLLLPPNKPQITNKSIKQQQQQEQQQQSLKSLAYEDSKEESSSTLTNPKKADGSAAALTVAALKASSTSSLSTYQTEEEDADTEADIAEQLENLEFFENNNSLYTQLNNSNYTVELQALEATSDINDEDNDSTTDLEDEDILDEHPTGDEEEEDEGDNGDGDDLQEDDEDDEEDADLLAEMVDDYSLNDSKVLDEVISTIDNALQTKITYNNNTNEQYATIQETRKFHSPHTSSINSMNNKAGSIDEQRRHDMNEIKRNHIDENSTDNNEPTTDNDDVSAVADVDVDDNDGDGIGIGDGDDNDINNEPHFDYSRMEYNFHNGIATHSLISPYGSTDPASNVYMNGNSNSVNGIGGASGNGIGSSGGGTINFDNYDNIIYSTMELECMPGYDGGLQQQFYLEAYDSKTKKLRLNTTSTYADVPIFRIDLSDLTPMDYYPDPNPALHLVVYSVNQKGRSEAIVLENIPINEAEKRSDGRMGLSILPIAALLTGTLFTVGIAVLFVVVVAVRKRRCQGGRNTCDDKDKHLGMDVTVTAPLETGPGHQRLVVAYTLKQGIEKQPDILSAQKNATGSATSSPLGNRPSGIFIDTNTSNGGVGSKASNYTNTNGGVVGGGVGGAGNNSTTGNYDSPTLTTDPLQQQLNSPPSQSSTLKLGQESRKHYQTPPLLYDALSRHDISRYDPLPLSMNYGGSNSTLSSGGSGGNASLTNNATVQSSLMQNNLSNGNYTNHHTLPHTSAVLQQHQQQHTSTGHHTLGAEKLSITDYLTASTLIDYNLSKSAAGMLTNAIVGGGSNHPSTASSSSANTMGHMTLPKGLGLGTVIGVTNSPAAMPTSTLTPSASANLSITQKTAANRNHIITDTLPGPESCV